jgi:SAM-dependent methyltransferase
MAPGKTLRDIEFDAAAACRLRLLDMLERPAEGAGTRLLDVGCNDGSFTLRAAERCGAGETYGMDVDDGSLDAARKNGVRAQKGNANEKFPFESDFFDVVISNQVIEHLLDPDNFFEEVHRVLKPGGYCVIATPNLCSLHNRLFVLLGWQITNIAPSGKLVFGNPNRGNRSGLTGPYRHYTVFAPPALKEMAAHYGLKAERLAGSGFHPFKAPVSRWLSAALPKWSVFILLKARKR